MHHSDLVSIRTAKGKGRGVFARRPIAKGEIVERVPVIVLPAAAFEGGWKNQTLNQYFYVWTKTTVAISLGYGSIYNHSYEPNAIYNHDYRNRRLMYIAYRDIAEGEEITVNYNYDPKSKTPMEFFDVAKETKASR
ncbi:MAG: SET domain-containing protein [Gemmataceae bacterium]|nr:SET domain-containing protein [Gemmataceae bacterium]